MSDLLLLQTALEFLELQDSEIDVYVDTTAHFRIIVICNTGRIDFTKQDVAIMKRRIENQNDERAISNPDQVFGIMEAKFNKTKDLTMVKYSTPIMNKTDRSIIYNTIYYLTAKEFTLVVYEYSIIATDIEKYLWSVKVH